MLDSIQQSAKDKASAYFLAPAAFAVGSGEENIIGWGIGTKATDSAIQFDKGVVRVYVSELPGPTVPEGFGDLPTEVVEVGTITAYQSQSQHQPVIGGVSVGHPNVTAGTLGCLVEKEGNHYILSNNHVLADSNGAAPGDPILQPGTVDGGSAPDDVIATLEPYTEIDFSEGGSNAIDAAIAKVGDSTQTLVEPEIIGIGNPSSTPCSPALDQRVRKSGRTTGHTVGILTDLSADIKVFFSDDRVGFFTDQIGFQSAGHDPFAQAGDSGSLIVDEQTLEPVALLFAGNGSGGTIFANPIKLVLDEYEVTIVGTQGVDA